MVRTIIGSLCSVKFTTFASTLLNMQRFCLTSATARPAPRLALSASSTKSTRISAALGMGSPDKGSHMCSAMVATLSSL
ncbi:uncharacterized protein SCHCODRAFT_02611594 [Schizophyllum commune H4-8]|uniref:uncharacterized protein n=1 Tax=Schizophyllum commune (strain H4-8 / FGSC 9210) TaxID=578458 RepID=UPI002160ABEE|nr:uncharacterized protein SCHCODRAFT_02611594 [Schizophyllum commune H4-8]KAI5898261.1 hypothetical protein SCHCODRAFT_02611594 [Schizophyllum commune H4-8]